VPNMHSSRCTIRRLLHRKLWSDMKKKKLMERHIRIQLPITYENVRDQIMLFRVNDRKWLDADIEKLPELLALIFSLWTLLKSEHFERERER
jgi:hypothetical protein